MRSAAQENTIRDPGSFRDPSGFIFRRNGIVYRQVNRYYAIAYERLMNGGLYKDLVERGDMLEHERSDETPVVAEIAHAVIRPRQVGFISYPYEWCFSQLKDAALLTLRIQLVAMQHGMSLKDASAYNVQFDRGRPVFIDTLSFEEYREGEPWVGYGQFCRHFLAPLALAARVDVRLDRLLREFLDGVPLDLASKLLPWRSRISIGLGLHLHAHAATQRKHANTAGPVIQPRKAQLSKQALGRLIESLRSTVESLDWNPGNTEWADYYAANNNYGEEGLKQKEIALRELLAESKSQTVWDLGGNTGRFTRVATEKGASGICFDIDPACVEANYRHAKSKIETNILPLLMDLTNPSPALGWAHAERSSLAQRGPADLILALGLVHHLAISNNLPLGYVAEYFAALGKNLIIEFVPKEDSQVQRLLASRVDIFPSYTREGFESAFSNHFEIQRKLDIVGTVRILYLMRTREPR